MLPKNSVVRFETEGGRPIRTTDPKHWYESKILWFNIVMTCVDVADFLGTLPLLPHDWAVVPPIVHGVGNVILRVWFTDRPVANPMS